MPIEAVRKISRSLKVIGARKVRADGLAQRPRCASGSRSDSSDERELIARQPRQRVLRLEQACRGGAPA